MKILFVSNQISKYLLQDNFFEKISPNSEYTVFDVFKMTQAVMTANNLSYTAVLDIIKLMNLTLGQKKLPESLHLFKKVCCESMNYSKIHFCPKCMKICDPTEADRKVCAD